MPPTVTDVAAIEAGAYHSLALRTDGTVLAWGAGTNNLESLPYFGQCVVPPAATGITAVSGGFFHSLALRSNGTVLAWGAGTNNVGFPHFSQSIVPPEATGVVAIAGGGYHSLALRANGTVVAWGATNGVPYSGQSEVPSSATNIVAIAAGSHHSVALRSNGTVVVWGSNVYGQTNVLPTATGVVAIASGEGHVLALRGDGRVVVWGKSVSGQTNVPAAATGVVAIAGGGEYSLALRSDGTLIAWGGNANGETDVPAEATGVLAISGGGNHVVALRSTKGTPPFARLDSATNVFQGTISAASFIGDGSGLVITSFVKKASDTMTGKLNLPDGGLAVGSSNFVVATNFVGVGRTNVITANEVFGIRAPQTNGYGGMYVQTAGAAAKPFYGYAAGGGAAAFHYIDGNDTNKWKLNVGSFYRITVNANNGFVGIGTTAPTATLHVVGNIYATGTITPSSDRNVKKNIEPVDVQAILEKLSAMPLQTWTYKAEDDGIRHLGPMAQDFQAAFGLGANNISIATVDADGVALAAIQALKKDADAKAAKLEAVEKENAALKAQLDEVLQRLRALEAK